MLDEREARVAAILFACSPLTLPFGVTSFDYLDATWAWPPRACWSADGAPRESAAPPPGRRLRLRPHQHAARHRGGLPPQRRLGPTLLVLGLRLARRLGCHAGTPDRRGRVALSDARQRCGDRWAVVALGAFTKAETERIWLFLVPPACVAAAPAITRGRVTLVVALLLAQALVVETLFDTIW